MKRRFRKRKRPTRAASVARPRGALRPSNRLHAAEIPKRRVEPIRNVFGSIFKNRLVIANAERREPIRPQKELRQPKKAMPFKNPFERIAGQRLKEIRIKICKNRKQIRKDIMKLTKGKGMKIKKAKWSLESKEIKCR